ncbi:Hypothetical protein A7982_03999 [Minicystis rosea]|nr:Hypothetical protein A7982_03999 [Minicystis rosea]
MGAQEIEESSLRSTASSRRRADVHRDEIRERSTAGIDNSVR